MKKLSKYLPHVLIVAIPVMFLVTGKSTRPTPNDVVQITRPSTTAEFAKTSVKITIPDKTSGGSGVILRSSREEGSVVLTNHHVCEVIQAGGLVITTDDKDHKITEYKVYDGHDLCLVRTKDNLKVNTAVAENDPEIYSTAYISGHPALLPHVLGTGNFSNYLDIDVLVGVEPCVGDKDENPLECIFLGGKAVLKSYESELVTSMIMPGSSGSAVFNKDGEISNLVFAGASQGLSYAFTVPHKFLKDFLDHEKDYQWEKANKKVSETAMREIIKTNCLSRKTIYSDSCPWN